jgi:L-asparaginase/Glu-tRNA(Gln) amidotransferase subunit D
MTLEIARMQSLTSAHNASSGRALPAQLQTNVLIIYTGGTIGMQPGSDGSLQPCKGFLTDMIPKMDELTRPGMPRATGQLHAAAAAASARTPTI